MVYFHKRLTSEVLGEINEMIIAKARKPNREEKKTTTTTTTAMTMILIRHRGYDDQRCHLRPVKHWVPAGHVAFNKARESAEKIIDALFTTGVGIKPRTYMKEAHKEYLRFARRRKRTKMEAMLSVLTIHTAMFMTMPLVLIVPRQTQRSRQLREIAFLPIFLLW
jgi:hypothetical protein